MSELISTKKELAAKMVAVLREYAPQSKRFYIRRWLAASGLWWVSIEVTILNANRRPFECSKSSHFKTESEAIEVETELMKLNA